MKIKTPTTLNELLMIAKRPLWAGKAYCSTAITNVEAFIKVVGDLPLAEVKTVHIDAFVQDMDNRLADATINRKLTNVHTILKYALDREWISKMPKITYRSEDNDRVRWLSPEEEKQMFELLDAWGETEIARFLTVLIETGMRRGELMELEAKNIDGDWIRLWKNKTKKARSIPLNIRSKSALEKGTFEHLTVGQIRIVWNRLKEHMGLQGDDDFVLHSLRHTAATRTLAKTKNIAVVQKLLGHRKIETTLRYAHISDDELLAAVR
jgi:integrase